MCLNAVGHVLTTLEKFDVKLCVQDSNPWWVQGGKACKIEVCLNLNEPDMLLATVGDGPVEYGQTDGRIGGSGRIIYLLTSIVVKQ